jgi:pentatricopeptide repeat protein
MVTLKKFLTCVAWTHNLAPRRTRGLIPGAVAYTAAAGACAAAGRWAEARQLLADMRRDGVAPDELTYNACISACEPAYQVTHPWCILCFCFVFLPDRRQHHSKFCGREMKWKQENKLH